MLSRRPSKTSWRDGIAPSHSRNGLDNHSGKSGPLRPHINEKEVIIMSQPQTRQPLAVRVRPTSIDDVIGQDAALGEGSIIRHMLDASAPPISVIMYAPPASGKTTIARIMAATAGIHFVELSATSAKVSDVRKVLTDAQHHLDTNGTPTIVFIDEIHRFSKSQQDVLLPGVEHGVIRLVGATTENPSFSVNSALLSRCVVVTLSTLTDDDISSERSIIQMGWAMTRRTPISPMTFVAPSR